MKNQCKKIFLCFIFILSFLSTPSFAKRPFIVDTDASIDDAIGILYLLSRHDIDLKAITIESTGLAHCKPALANMSGLVALSDMKPIPMACGRETPLEGNHQFPAELRAKADSLLGMAETLPETNMKISDHAVTLLKKTLQASKKPVDILAIGPLTNLAELVMTSPNIKNKIHMIYIMGGALNVSGNLQIVDPAIKNTTAEWNFYIDPKAADILFRSHVPITLFPLDVTNQIPVDEDFYKELNASQKNTDVARFLSDLFMRNKKEFLTQGYYFWDSLPAAVATKESIASFANKKVKISATKNNFDGTTMIDNKNGTSIRICTEVKPAQFTQLVLQTTMPPYAIC